MKNNVFYTTNAVCASYRLTQDAIEEMVSCGLAEPVGDRPNKWLFTQSDYDRIGCVKRFKNELDVNIPGAVLALELLEQLDRIRKQVQHW